MTRRLLAAGLCVVVTVLWWPEAATQPLPQGLKLPRTLPFALVNDHIMLDASVDGRGGLSFMLDTGNRFGIIDLELAAGLNVPLGATIQAAGTAGAVQGRFTSGASYSLASLPGFVQPLNFALPLRHLSTRLGRSLDGLIGADFIEQFVVEVDYEAGVLRLHDPEGFSYTGPGKEIPISLSAQKHPVLRAVIGVGGRALEGEFVLDLGSGATVELNAPFVAKHSILNPPMTTVRALGFAGAAGKSTGRIGRLDKIAIGPFELERPQAFLSQDQTGTNAAAATQGRIGTSIAKKFRVFLDYRKRRIILEPNAAYRAGWHDAASGLLIEARGAGYDVFEVREVLEGSPAMTAGFIAGDIVLAVDGRLARDLSLSEILARFRVAGTYMVLIRRGTQDVAIPLATRPLV